MHQKAIAILKRAIEILAPDDSWTRFAQARRANGEKVEPHDASATSWDMVGAMRKASFELTGSTVSDAFWLAHDAVDRVSHAAGHRDTSLFNDHYRTICQHVIRALYRAIDMLDGWQNQGDFA